MKQSLLQTYLYQANKTATSSRNIGMVREEKTLHWSAIIANFESVILFAWV